MEETFFSIIIPHKNIPVLLQRCLDSIPLREDTQVIVVDDNSDPEIVDFGNFPGKERPDTTLIFTKEGKGAGYARNVGMDQAVGKWLIFMDADDFFSNAYNQILDEHKNDEEDILFCDNEAVMSDDIIVKAERDSYAREAIHGLLANQDDDSYLRYNFHALWGKIIRREMLIHHSIRFHEVRWSNDEYFSCLIGCHAEKTRLVPKVLYVLTQRSESLTSHYLQSTEEFIIRLKEAICSERYMLTCGVRPTVYQSLNILSFKYSLCGGRRFRKIIRRSIKEPKVFQAMIIFYVRSRFEALKKLL